MFFLAFIDFFFFKLIGPRLAALAGGYPGEIFTARRAYWIWTPIIACTLYVSSPVNSVSLELY